ncbi:MAG: tetratricopeptide repeat protein, partial [Gemmataceae bacterium]
LGQSAAQTKEMNDLPQIITGSKVTAAPTILNVPLPPQDKTSGPAKEADVYQGPIILKQSAAQPKDESGVSQIVRCSKLTASLSVPKVPLPPRDKTPRCAELQYEVAMVAMRAGACDKALSWLYSALREDANHAPSHKALMEYYQKTGDFLRAAEHRVKARLPVQSEADPK